MNYLAHAFLSGKQRHLLVGNFIADHLRGNNFEAFSPGVVQGLRLHRRIDTFTDQHPDFKSSKRFFYDGFERHSGILVDIFFDHLLARDFEKYSPVPLETFASEVYTIYRDHEKLLPKSSSRFLEYVVSNNIYTSYASLAGIEQVLTHLSHRINHRVQLNESLKLFNTYQDQLQTHFESFIGDALTEFPH